MKPKIRHIILRMLTIGALLLTTPVATISQPPPEDPLPNQQPVPIGSGLIILVALGAGYGIVKLKQRKSPKE